MDAQRIQHYITRIAAKLFNDGLTAETYNRQKAEEILSNTVAAKFCIEILNNNEPQIIEKMQTFTERL